MRATPSRLLDPAVLASVRDLRLLASTVVEGFLAGEHASPRPGPGVEFSQYRSYQPGDDPRRVDWTVYARTDRFFVRESEIEQDVTVRLILDATASMAHRDGPISRFDYARLLAASLAYLAHRQGDRLALHAVRSREEEEAVDLPPGRALAPVLWALEGLEPAGVWPEGEPLSGLLVNRREREVVVLITDLHQRENEVVRTAELLRVLGHEVMVLQLLAANELELSYRGDVRFEDLETGETVRARPAAIRAAYRRQVEESLRAVRIRLAEAAVEHQLLRLDEPLDRALRRFLVRRSRLR